MFYCDKCKVQREFMERDYYDFDHYVCPNCDDDLLFPASSYAPPDDDELLDDGVYWDADTELANEDDEWDDGCGIEDDKSACSRAESVYCALCPHRYMLTEHTDVTEDAYAQLEQRSEELREQWYMQQADDTTDYEPPELGM